MSIQPFARGKWKAKAPFVLDENIVYTCIGIRAFRDIEAEGVGVYELVYQPRALSEEVCETDRVNAVSIITLEAEGKPNVLIPTSYIQSYPTTVLEGFSRIVLAVEIGILSDKVPLDYLKAQLQQAVTDTVGVENATVELFTAPYRGVITPDQAEAMEHARQQLIRTGNNHYSENKRLQDALDLAEAKVRRLEQIIIDNSISV